MKRKNTKKSFWKKKSGRALIDAGKWLLTDGILTITLAGISLVYIDIFSIATLNQSANQGAFHFVSYYLNIFLFFLLILGFLFTRLGIRILRKKVTQESARKPAGIALIFAMLSLYPSGSVLFFYRGFSVIPISFAVLLIINIITIISLIRFFSKKDDEIKPKKKHAAIKSRNDGCDDDML